MAKRFLISSLFIATGLCQNLSGSLVAPKGAKILTVGVLGGKLDTHDKLATYH